MESDQFPSDMPKPPDSRDLRLDLIRGAALLCMHTDHFRHNELAGLTPRNFGFSDMAEIFVFVSGCVCGVVYGTVFQAYGYLKCQWKASLRVRQLVVACAVTLLALVMVQSWFAQAWTPKIVELMTGIQTLRHIEGGSQVMGILLLYGVLLAALPAMLWLREWHWCVLLGPSVLLYGATQMDWTLVSHLGQYGEITAFNPFAWQLMFVLGLLLYEPFRSGRCSASGRWIWPCAALVVIEGAFVCKCFFSTDKLPLLDKTTLGPLRVLHLLAVIILTGAVLPDQSHRFWKAWPIRMLILCGQNSLIVFCGGSVLVVLFEGILLAKSHAMTQQIAANLAVWCGCVLLSVAGDFYKSLTKNL